MALLDWVFDTAVVEGGPTPSNIITNIDTMFPFVGSGSLQMVDQGQPMRSVATAHPDPALHEVGHTKGKIRTILKKDVGSGFRDSGIYFLSDSLNPASPGCNCYFLEVPDGSTNIQVKKASNGLLDLGNITTIQVYTDSPSVPILNNASEVVCEVEWIGGLFIPFLGGVQIKVRYWENSTDFNDMVELSPIILDTASPLILGNAEGLYGRSRDTSEPLDAKFDNTRVSKFDVEP